ncbi:hypothetical protein ANN_17656 [Periplaneta americana]|uniref:Uncharacterized protein n=1 Tax=Periplaneta americana TaxID=6978 RepID=A0ABQ8SUS2_PERAM|nr:hypothetical protein ANN_17656 [Periplaneta americana]
MTDLGQVVPHHNTTPTLLPADRSIRNWVLAHQNWMMEEWRKVLFCDEIRVSLRHDTRRTRAWRQSGRRHQYSQCKKSIHFVMDLTCSGMESR